MNSTSQLALTSGSRTLPARAMHARVPWTIHPGPVDAGNAYQVFGRVGSDGIRRSQGVSGLLPVSDAITRDVRRGYSPARTNRGVSPHSLNPHLRGIALGSAQSSQIISSGIYTGLSTAALYDPEPISKTILAISAALVGLFSKVFAGCGQSCIQATKVVDQVESQYLKPLLEQYMSQPVHLKSVQDKALSVFDQAWGLVLQGCSDPQLGDAGRRCISERQRGGTSKWCPNCNWFTLYRDPIANDPNVVPDPIPDSLSNQGFQDSTSTGGTSQQSLMIGSGLSSTIGGVPVWMLALGGVFVLLASGGGGRD